MELVQQVTHLVVGAFVDELSRAGLRHVVACPGSRSTPLAMLFAAHHSIKLWMQIDERSAAFFALGLAKQLRQPVAVVCTSGTAAANFYPAVIEARYGRVPLVLLTADRPPELRDVGASQTIDQNQLYGTRVKWFSELPIPEANQDLLRYVRTTAVRAVATAQSEPAGPVHLNFPLREPLVPVPGGNLLPEADSSAIDGRPSAEPFVTVLSGRRTIESPDLQRVVEELARNGRGLIVVGPQDEPELPRAVISLARVLGWPVLADPLSLVRGETAPDLIIDAYDAFLRDPRAVAALAPDLVLRFGAMPVSKPLLQFFQQHPESRQVVVDGASGWNDPTLRTAEMIHADPVWFCRALSKRICPNVDLVSSEPLTTLSEDRQLVNNHFVSSTVSVRDDSWAAHWVRINELARQAIDRVFETYAEPFEGKVFHELSRVLSNGTTIFVGNSMPVRDLDTFFAASGRHIKLMGNRGASGIDGVVSSALGVSAGSREPVLLAIGDLSFYHDLNGLFAAKRHGLSLTIVLLNNNGGGIFSFLPQAESPEHFEELFGTPLGLDFRPVIEMYGGRYRNVAHWPEFRAAVQASVAEGGLSVIELKTDRAANVTQHRIVWRAVVESLDNELGPVAVR
ncbi:MAG TPA: 2-succinyl-5-enolpyruvyl-6-hydroxy-3-cyclohexene-1-carboxylic-acid synthase [Chloroflexota bacterium]|nr:2-succinyl-5-enolpyruvyl-6-hydroxy-3-cyclohexene-1-carboxylic-acid synthase [Chloroflexota bacterium]